MRIIHTSDWHLGQHFMSKSRAKEHQAFLAWLLQQIEAHQVEALIVAGDIFDTRSPPSYAREMYNRFVVDIQDKQCAFVVLGGNHDSVATLNESKDLLACLNTRVIATVLEESAEQLITLHTRQGEVGAILCAIPFIRQRDVLTSKAGQSGEEKKQAMQQAIADHYLQLYQQAVSLRDDYQQALPIIATGHLVTVGASTTESVREIYIGTLDAFPASGFPPADYIALGHIHKAQCVAKSEHIRYSGSPIPLSFDETGKAEAKSVLLVDFNEGKFVQATPLVTPCFQPMRVIKGDLESIEQQLIHLAKTVELVDGQTLWLDILVTSQDYLNDLQIRIEQLTADLPVEVLSLRRERKNKQEGLSEDEKVTLSELTVQDVFQRRLALEKWESEEEKQRETRLNALFKQVDNELKVLNEFTEINAQGDKA